MKTQSRPRDTRSRTSVRLSLLIALQVLCAVFFLTDVAADGFELGWPPFTHWHFMVEFAAALSLIAAVAFELRFLADLLRREAHLTRQVSLASGAFHDIVEAQFQSWGLTPSEKDVAMFLLKGLAIPEIAELRGSAEGTVKSHLNGVYRKAGVSGRGAFLALFIEELMSAPAAEEPKPEPAGSETRTALQEGA